MHPAQPDSAPNSILLGLECGGTRTVALATDAAGRLLHRIEAGPANSRLLSATQLEAHFRDLARQLPAPVALGIGMAGVREESDRRQVRAAAAKVWPDVPCWAGNDLETGLAAAEPLRPGAPVTRVIIISGTGSCCYGCNPAGMAAKVGGWGHLLGDQASGYAIAHEALRAVIHAYDLTGTWPALGARVLRARQLNEPNELITWIHQASKAEIAALTVEVFSAAAAGDRIARGVIAAAAERLAADAAACARRLSPNGGPAEFVFIGSVLLRQPGFARVVARHLRQLWPGARTRPLTREGAWGAVVQAATLARNQTHTGRLRSRRSPAPHPKPAADAPDFLARIQPRATATSPTEQRNPRSLDLDRRSIRSAIELMLAEEDAVATALRQETDAIEKAVRRIVRSFRAGGRLFYVGAGTSGRLGVLDASECPPTFRTPPELVQGIMAGGYEALWASIEGAEDDAPAGAAAIAGRDVRRGDVVVGIAASGRTPFVWGALHEARRRGATIMLLAFNPHLAYAPGLRPDVAITPSVGPEVLTGSTRLKAGTATKLVLNLLTTLAMVRLGKVASNLMVDLNPSNVKLRDRAVRIVRDLTGVEADRAEAALVKAEWRIPAALKALRRARRAA